VRNQDTWRLWGHGSLAVPADVSRLIAPSPFASTDGGTVLGLESDEASSMVGLRD